MAGGDLLEATNGVVTMGIRSGERGIDDRIHRIAMATGFDVTARFETWTTPMQIVVISGMHTAYAESFTEAVGMIEKVLFKGR